MSKFDFNEIKKGKTTDSKPLKSSIITEASQEDPFDKLLMRLLNDKKKYSYVSDILSKAEKEYLYFKNNSSIIMTH